MNNSNLSFHSANSAINFKGNNQNFLADSHVSGKEDFNEFTFQLIIIPQGLELSDEQIKNLVDNISNNSSKTIEDQAKNLVALFIKTRGAEAFRISVELTDQSRLLNVEKFNLWLTENSQSSSNKYMTQDKSIIFNN